jgi:hypothetical protein
MPKHLRNAYAFNIHSSLLSRYLFLFSIYFGLPGLLSAQEPPRNEIDITQFIQSLFPVPAEDSEDSDLYESLFQLYASPLDLNTATPDELSATLILSETQLRSFFEYREKLGPLLSLYELQAIPGFDLPTIQKLLPFVIVKPKPVSFRESLKNPSQHFLMLRSGKLLEKQKGFTVPDSGSNATTRYQGQATNGYLRYRNARTGSYSFGFTLEKDAGEKFWKWEAGKQIFGIDFTSFHAQIMNRGKLKNLIMGDYQVQAGQGMILGAGFSLGKGSEVIRTVYRSTLGIRPYTSVMEANFLRGVAATYAINPHIDLTAFYSATRRDASQEQVLDVIITTSLPISGYHRTPSEREKHNILPEHNAGLHILYKPPSQKGQLGFTLLHTAYHSTIRKRDLPYNRYEFSGKQNFIAGAHGDYRWQNFHFFGEGAVSKSGGTGLLAGIIAGLGKKWDLSLLARRYSRSFHTFYGNSLSESTRPINEAGAYAGLRYMPNRRWQLSAYYDRFRFPWLKYQIDAPSKGFDYYFHTLYKPNKRFNAYMLYHEKHKQHNQPGDLPSLPLATTILRTAMINVEYEVPLRFSVRTRFQYGNFAYKNISISNGITVFQDVTWHFPKIELSGRLAFFKTDDYDSRQYAYEKDMLYAFSIPAYYDTGTRHYLMARYNLTKDLKMWLRWSQTRYAKLDKISSGLNEINGNKRSEIKAQVMYQF